MKSDDYALFDLAQWKNGLAFKKINFSSSGKPVIKIAELKNGITDQTQFTDGDYGDEVHLTKGDMLFSWSGNPETSIDVFWYNLPDGWLNQHIFKITPKPFVDRNFLYYILKYLKPNFIAIASNKQTTGLGHITIKDLKAETISLPSMKVQKIISDYLFSIDQKINANQAINDNLQQQTQAIYTNMFITNADDKWQRGHLSDIITIKYGKDHKKLADGSYPVFGSGGIMRYVERPLYNQESVMIPRKGTLNNVMYINEPFWSVDTMFYTEMKISNSAKFVYHFVKSQNLSAMNSGSAVPSMATEILNNIEIAIPSSDILDQFDSTVSPLYMIMEENKKQNLKLIKLRDALLPKLMSGELDVSELDI